MNLVLLYNSISGNGKASQRAQRFEEFFRAAGHGTSLVEASNGTTGQRLREPLKGAGALVVLGGDGTLNSCADAAIESGTPIYHVPLGTENLFARQFGMDGSTQTLERALGEGRIVEVDAATCNGRTFVLMLSVGPDASVIHRLDRVRNGTINHLSYVGPVLAEAVSPSLTPLTVVLDGREVVRDRAGLLVVANSARYALGIDPARAATMTDGRLDVVFFPGSKRVDLLGWALTARLGTHISSPNLIYETGEHVRITCNGRDMPVQLDGEAAGTIGQGLDVRVGGKRLRVLVPATARAG